MADTDLDQLLRNPTLVAAVRDLGVSSLALEDVLHALRSLGQVRIELDDHPERPYLCQLDSGGECERARGRTVLNAALACWAEALEAFGAYTQHGLTKLERFLLDPDVTSGPGA